MKLTQKEWTLVYWSLVEKLSRDREAGAEELAELTEKLLEKLEGFRK